MHNKLISAMIVSLLFIANQIYCNSGGITDSTDAMDAPVKKTRSSSLVTAVPDDGNIEGLVITSCGQCNLGYKGIKGCSLTIKIDKTIYPVEGTGIHDHGDAHGKEGFCSAVRVAWATGQIKKKVFHADSFVLVGDSE